MSMDGLAGLWLVVGFAAGWGLNHWRRGPQRLPDGRAARLSDADQETLRHTQLAYQLAHEMAQLQAGFLARTAHELRSPLNGVISLHQLILADLCDDPAEEREFVRQAQDAAKKLLALLDEATGVSKLEHGTAQLTWEAIPLVDMLNEVKTLTHLQARNRNLRLEIALPDPCLCVWSDRRWLRQILVNLIITPIYLMEEGTICLTTQTNAETQQVYLTVTDQRPARSWREAADLMGAGASGLLPGIKPGKPHRESLYPATSDPADGPLITPDQAAHASGAIAFPPAPDQWKQHSLSGLRLIMSQCLIQHVGGQLTLEAVPDEDAGDAIETGDGGGCTRIRCSLPLAIAPSPEKTRQT